VISRYKASNLTTFFLEIFIILNIMPQIKF